MGPRLAFTIGALAAIFAPACSTCPSGPPPDQFCFVWPVSDSPAAKPGPCPTGGKASLFLQAEGTDARGAAVTAPFDVLGPGDTLSGHCCYLVQEILLCP